MTGVGFNAICTIRFSIETGSCIQVSTLCRHICMFQGYVILLLGVMTIGLQRLFSHSGLPWWMGGEFEMDRMDLAILDGFFNESRRTYDGICIICRKMRRCVIDSWSTVHRLSHMFLHLDIQNIWHRLSVIFYKALRRWYSHVLPPERYLHDKRSHWGTKEVLRVPMLAFAYTLPPILYWLCHFFLNKWPSVLWDHWSNPFITVA